MTPSDHYWLLKRCACKRCQKEAEEFLQEQKNESIRKENVSEAYQEGRQRIQVTDQGRRKVKSSNFEKGEEMKKQTMKERKHEAKETKKFEMKEDKKENKSKKK